MATPLTARSLVAQVRTRVADPSALTWDDAEILEVADDVLQELWTEIRTQASEYSLDSIVVTPVLVNGRHYEATLPEWVGTIRRVETTNTRGVTCEIPHSQIQGRDYLTQRGDMWHRAYGLLGGKIAVYLSSVADLRVFYIRRWAPLHFGTAQVQSVGPVNTKLRLASAPTGKLVRRAGLLIGMHIEISADVTTPANRDQIRLITSEDTSTYAGEVVPVTDAWLGIPNANTQYSLVLPLEPEFASFAVMSTVWKLFERDGNVNHLQAMQPSYDRMRRSFEEGLRDRDTARPRRIWSNM